MTYINWICIAVFAVDFGLFVTSYIIKNEILKKISSVFLLPLIVFNPLYFLFDYIPDSLHCIHISITAFSFFWLFQILMIFNKNALTFILARLSFLLGTGFLIYYYRTVFFVYKIPLWLIILSGILLFIIIVATEIFSTPKKSKRSLQSRVLSVITVATTYHLFFCTFIGAIFNRKTNNMLLLFGSLLLLFSVIFYLINNARLKLKFAKEIRQTAILFSMLAISLSNLMIFAS